MRLLQSFFCIALLCVFTAGIAVAQFSLTGTVVDKQSKEPLADVSVKVSGTGSVATTDAQGKFELTSTSDFSRITVSRIGYKSQDITVSDKSATLTIELVSSNLTMHEVEVTGWAPQGGNINEPRSINTLSTSELNRTSGLSLDRSLNTLPGVDMQSRTGWGGQRITIRGYYPSVGNSANFNGLGYQLFLNNVPVTDASGATIMDDIDFSTLGNVEVIKGPASSRFGSYIAGTVNLQTARPKDNQTSIEQQFLGGSYGLFRNNTTLRSAGDNAAYTVNYGHQTYKGFRDHDASKKDYVAFTGDFTTSADNTVSTYYSYNHSYEELAGEIDSVDFYNKVALSDSNYLANGSRVQIESFRAGVTNLHRFNDEFSNSTTVFATGHSLNQPFAHGFTDVSRLSFGGRTAVEYSHNSADHGINATVGLAFQRTNVNSNGVFMPPIPNPPSFPSASENYALTYYPYTEVTVSFQDAWVISGGLNVTFNEYGVRNMLAAGKLFNGSVPSAKSFDPVVNPQISIMKLWDNKVSTYLTVSNGFTPPLLTNILANNGTIDTLLKPERAWQIELGAKGRVMDNRLSYQIALFDLEITDKLVSQTVSAVTFTTNAGKQRNRGAELSLGYLAVDDQSMTLSLVRPWFSYTYSDYTFTEFKSDNNNLPGTIDYSGHKVPLVAPHMFNIGVDCATNFGLTFNATFRYKDKIPVTIDNNNNLNSYSILAARIGYTRNLDAHWGINLFAGVDNLTGSTYYNLAFVGANIGGLAQPKDGGSGDGYILPAPYSATGYGNATLTYTF